MSELFASLAIDVEAPARMIIRNYRTGLPLKDESGQEAYIDFLGPDSARVRKYENVRWSEMRGALRDREETERQAIERLAAATVAWRLVGLDGALLNVECNEANARALYSDIRMRWLADQGGLFQSDRANFGLALSSN